MGISLGGKGFEKNFKMGPMPPPTMETVKLSNFCKVHFVSFQSLVYFLL